MNIPGEKEFTGRGVSYCATCDAMFFKNKTVAVVGGGNSALTAALYLAEVATKVYLIVRGQEFKGEVVWQDQVRANAKIEVIFGTNVIGLEGEDKLTGVKLDQPHNNEEKLAIEGLFIEIGSTPDTSLFDNLKLEINASNHIMVKVDQTTSAPQVWAAGDITNGSNNLRQVITACSEGAIAAGNIFQYLQKNK
jgi:thioredoxin reductase (NADPH)